MNAGGSPEEKALLQELRVALLNSYISILHGLFNHELDGLHLASNQEERQEAFAMQMFQYLEALVRNDQIDFPVELLQPMFELYLDLASMYIGDVSYKNGRR